MDNNIRKQPGLKGIFLSDESNINKIRYNYENNKFISEKFVSFYEEERNGTFIYSYYDHNKVNSYANSYIARNSNETFYSINFNSKLLYEDFERIEFKKLENLSKLKYLYFNFAANSFMDAIYLKKENLVIGKNYGYIYLKPIKIDAMASVSIKSIFKGNVIFEVFSEKIKKWIVVKDGFKCNGNALNLRIKLNTNDKIIKIFILKN